MRISRVVSYASVWREAYKIAASAVLLIQLVPFLRIESTSATTELAPWSELLLEIVTLTNYYLLNVSLECLGGASTTSCSLNNTIEERSKSPRWAISQAWSTPCAHHFDISGHFGGEVSHHFVNCEGFPIPSVHPMPSLYAACFLPSIPSSLNSPTASLFLPLLPVTVPTDPPAKTPARTAVNAHRMPKLSTMPSQPIRCTKSPPQSGPTNVPAAYAPLKTE